MVLQSETKSLELQGKKCGFAKKVSREPGRDTPFNRCILGYL